MLQVASAHVRKIVHDTSYQKTIRTFEENFNANLRTLLAALRVFFYSLAIGGLLS